MTTPPRPQPYNRYPGDDSRPAYAAGLRHLADLVEIGTTPVPYGTVDLFLAFSSLSVDEQAAAARKLTRALGGGTWAKDASDATMSLDGMCGGVPVRIYVAREAVCERVVVRTEEVEVPAQPETVLPAVEAHTATREVVEWRCGPLLAAAETADAVDIEQVVEVTR